MAMTPSPAQDAVSAPNKSQEEVEENGQSAGEVQGGERSSLRLGSISRPVTRYDCFTDAISFYFSSKGAAETGEAPVKRGRGRPKGSKNKKGLGDAAAPAPDTPKKKRGRPPKVGRFLNYPPAHHRPHDLAYQSILFPTLQEKKPEEDGEPAPKKKRGRPPKNPKPEVEVEAGATSGGEGGGEGGESSEKKKRGRPPKSAGSTT